MRNIAIDRQTQMDVSWCICNWTMPFHHHMYIKTLVIIRWQNYINNAFLSLTHFNMISKFQSINRRPRLILLKLIQTFNIMLSGFSWYIHKCYKPKFKISFRILPVCIIRLQVMCLDMTWHIWCMHAYKYKGMYIHVKNIGFVSHILIA